jgi:CBS domain-containing protein
MKVYESIRRSAVAVEVDRPVAEVARVMEQAAVGSVVVLDGGTPVGIVTDRDLVRRWLAHRLEPEARIDAIMSTPLVTIPADADVRDVYRLFDAHAVRRIAAVDPDGSLVGVLSVDDVLMNLVADLTAVVKPVTAEVLFGQRDAGLPAVPAEEPVTS